MMMFIAMFSKIFKTAEKKYELLYNSGRPLNALEKFAMKPDLPEQDLEKMKRMMSAY